MRTNAIHAVRHHLCVRGKVQRYEITIIEFRQCPGEGSYLVVRHELLSRCARRHLRHRSDASAPYHICVDATWTAHVRCGSKAVRLRPSKCFPVCASKQTQGVYG